jgi:hypothetical protein
VELINYWAVKLAEATAPSEAALAPAITSAYLQGGSVRADLFRQTGIDAAGGFGIGGLEALLPWILRSLIAASNWLYTLLASDELGNAIAAVKDGVELAEKVGSKQPKEAITQMPNNAPYSDLKHVMNVIGAELRTAGIVDDQADLITFRVINALLEKPESAVEFVRQLEAAQ